MTTDTRSSVTEAPEGIERVVTGRRPDDFTVPAGSGVTGDGWDDAEPIASDPPGRPHARFADVPYVRLTALALIGLGAMIVLFVVYLFVFTPLTASRNQHRLVQSLVGQPKAVYRLVDGHPPAEGSAAAILDIPAIHVRQVVVQGTSAADLMNGPGLLPGSAFPGAEGNSVILGRRVTFGAPFGALGSLRKGDAIRVVDGAGRFTYRVTRTLTVTAGHRDVIVPTIDNRITLVTSNSSLVTGGRLAVQGRLVGRSASTPGTVTLPRSELGLGGDSVAGGLAVIWTLLTIVVLVAAGLATWRWRRPWLVYLFAAPIIVACGLFACESVARALPATF